MEYSTNPRAYPSDKFPFFSRPWLIGYFSVGPERNYIGDLSQLKYVRKIPEGNVSFDLNHQVEMALKRKKEREMLKFLLTFLKDHTEVLNVFDTKEICLEDVPFVCYRGFLRAIGALPYANQEPFRISACLFRGVIYMHSLETPESKARNDTMSEREKQMCAWGYKFEQYMSSESPDKEPSTDSPVDESAEFSCVFSGRLNNHQLLYAAEVDGILLGQETETEATKLDGKNLTEEEVLSRLRRKQLVELKTTRLILEEKHSITFRRHKTLAWWLQSFFAGIETVVCGFRDDAGLVTDIKTYKMFELPADSINYWHPNVCMNFCDGFLTYVKRCFAAEIQCQVPRGSIRDVRNLPKLQLVFHREPRRNVRISRPLPDENINVLDDWFIQLFPKV